MKGDLLDTLLAWRAPLSSMTLNSVFTLMVPASCDSPQCATTASIYSSYLSAYMVARRYACCRRTPDGYRLEHELTTLPLCQPGITCSSTLLTSRNQNSTQIDKWH